MCPAHFNRLSLLVPSSRVRLLVITMTIFLQASRSLVKPHSSVSVQFVTALMSSSQCARGLLLFLVPPPSPNIIDFFKLCSLRLIYPKYDSCCFFINASSGLVALISSITCANYQAWIPTSPRSMSWFIKGTKCIVSRYPVRRTSSSSTQVPHPFSSVPEAKPILVPSTNPYCSMPCLLVYEMPVDLSAMFLVATFLKLHCSPS